MNYLDKQIEQETDVSRKYWLKQARMHFRSSETHRKQAERILIKMATYKPGEKLVTGV